jgi:nitrite reductase (NADH) small subunit
MTDWKKICPLDDIPRLGSRQVKSESGMIAVFRTAEDEIGRAHV